MMSTSTQVTGSGCLIMPAPARVWVLFREVHAVRYVRQRTSRCRPSTCSVDSTARTASWRSARFIRAASCWLGRLSPEYAMYE